MLYLWEVEDLVVRKTGIRLNQNELTYRLPLRKDERVSEELFGPFLDADEQPMETRLYVVVSEVDGSTSFQLLVQDCEGDFLNNSAEGAEKYNVGIQYG